MDAARIVNRYPSPLWLAVFPVVAEFNGWLANRRVVGKRFSKGRRQGKGAKSDSRARWVVVWLLLVVSEMIDGREARGKAKVKVGWLASRHYLLLILREEMEPGMPRCRQKTGVPLHAGVTVSRVSQVARPV